MKATTTTPNPADQPINQNDAPPGCIAVEPPVQYRCTGCKYAPGTTCTLGGFECGRKSRADRRNVIFIDAPTPTTQPAPTPTPPPARPPTCSSCRFWDTSVFLPEALNFAPCHRHPPRVNFDFPFTYPTSWCGEHQPNP